jgi:hypothetical protein
MTRASIRPRAVHIKQMSAFRTGDSGRLSGSDPGARSFDCCLVPAGNASEATRDLFGVDKAILEEGADEVEILLAEGDQLRDAEILLVETPAGETRLSCWRGRVRVLHPDKTVAPASGRTAVSRSTPSMLKPWSSSNHENSPATPSMRSASRAVSSLLSAIVRMSTSMDMVAAAGSCDSS